MGVTISIPDAVAYGGDECLPDRLHGQDIAAAAYNTAHGYPGGVRMLAKRMSVNPNTFTNKVNPNNATHHLSPAELVLMQRASGNYAVLHAMAEALGHTCTLATPDQSGGNPVDTLMRLQCQLADFVRAVADAVREGDGGVTGNQVRRADYDAQELIAAVGHTMAMLRGRMRKAPQV